jgi:hypothetical protein
MAESMRVATGAAAEPERLRTRMQEHNRVCPCGRPIAIAEDHVGRRPRLCGRCKQTRRALSYIRAGARILERLKDPDYQGVTDG